MSTPASSVTGLQGGRIMLYASRTGSPRQLRAFRTHQWRILVSMAGVWRTEGFRYCLDNGAWTCHTQGIDWDAGRYLAFANRLMDDADFVVVPDIVEGGLKSLHLSESWLPKLTGLRLLPVQDGMTPDDVRGLLGPTVGIAIGGSGGWKERTALKWGSLAQEQDCHLHMLRVNSRRRLRICAAAGVDSTDGTSGTKYSKNVPKMERWKNEVCQQQSIFGVLR